MEEAIFIKKIQDINKSKTNYERIYFGEEFCENKLPSLKDFKSIYEYTYQNQKKLTIVFPYVTDNGLMKIKHILDSLDIYSPRFEIVANDWGVIHLIKEKYPEANVAVGRLLNKIKRDPRIKAAETFLPKETYDLYKSSNLLTNVSEHLLRLLDIEDIEFDYPLHGVNLKENDFNYIVHYPFGYITTTRLCLKNISTHNNKNEYSCSNRLCEYTILEHKNDGFPCRVFQKGNTVFYYNTIPKEELMKLGFKRIINHEDL